MIVRIARSSLICVCSVCVGIFVANTLIFLFSNKMLVISLPGLEFYKMFVRIVNREDPDQTASSEAVWSVSALFVKAFLAGN